MSVRAMLAIYACKFTRKIIRLRGGGATNFPGKVALKIYPDLLGYLAKDVTTIIVTGTNGKTTTSRMLEQLLENNGCSFFCNKSGANLMNGITAEFVDNTTLTGKKIKEYALIECDEAAFKKVGKYVNPQYVVVTNVFRDQLDRFGEITNTLENIRQGILASPEAKVCLNADCSMTASLASTIPNEVHFFGVDVPIYKERVNEALDAPYCIHCRHPYSYDYITFGHLGKYRCDHCGYTRPHPEVFVRQVYSSNEKCSQVEISANGVSTDATINLPGGYNIYNAIATVCMAKVMGFPRETALEALADFQCGFGRMEELMLGTAPTRMILIKNPAGCNQVLNFLSNLSEESIFVICLNDQYADGRDISWIWDVDFETLTRIQDKLARIYVTGTRSYDMATRLKYAGLPLDMILVEKDYNQLVEDLTKETKPVYIMPTYTAMMELRTLIAQKFNLKNFWE